MNELICKCFDAVDSALQEAQEACKQRDIEREKREEANMEKLEKKPAPYKHVKVR